MTSEELTVMRKNIEERSREDFEFMVLCSSKGNMGMYHFLRDTQLAADIEKLKQLEAEHGVPQ